MSHYLASRCDRDTLGVKDFYIDQGNCQGQSSPSAQSVIFWRVSRHSNLAWWWWLSYASPGFNRLSVFSASSPWKGGTHRGTKTNKRDFLIALADYRCAGVQYHKPDKQGSSVVDGSLISQTNQSLFLNCSVSTVASWEQSWVKLLSHSHLGFWWSLYWHRSPDLLHTSANTQAKGMGGKASMSSCFKNETRVLGFWS